MSAERVGFRPKTPEQLRQQVDAVSSRIGHPIIPVSLGDQAITTEAQELQRRFPNHMGVHAGELRSLRREEHDIFFAEDPEKGAQREGIIRRWEMQAPLVANINRHVEAHQRREIPGVAFKPRQMGMFEKIRDRVEDGDMEGTIEAPTGWGKTIIFNQIAAAANVPTIILVPTKDLVEQTYKQFQDRTPHISVGRVNADFKEYGNQVTITTYQSLLVGDEARLINPDGIGLVIFDEAHKAISENRVMKVENLEQFRNAVFVGLSATPIEITDPRFIHTRVAQMTKKIWDEVPFADAVLEGYLSSFHSVVARVTADLSNVRITASGEYNEEDVDKAINTVTQNEAAVNFFLAKREEDRLEREMLGKKPLPFTTSWFSASVAQAQEHARLLRERGIRAEAVWGTSDKRERDRQKRIMEQWERGEIEVVCSNMKLVEGTDIKPIRAVFNVAPTARVWVEKQRTGRGMRTDDENNPDKDTLVVDFVYSGTHMRSPQVIFPQLVGAVKLTRQDISAQQSSSGGLPVGAPAIQVEGIEIVTDEEEILRISNEMLVQRHEGGFLDTETEIGITTHYIKDRFVGSRDRIQAISVSVLRQMNFLIPNAWRMTTFGENWRRGRKFAALRREFLPLYLELMQQRGLKLQEQNKPVDSECEIAINGAFLVSAFIRGVQNVPISDEVLSEIAIEHPDAWRTLLIRGGPMPVLKLEFEGLYRHKMKEKGVRETVSPIVSEIETGVTNDFLDSMFVGGPTNLRFTSDQSLARISEQYPDSWRYGVNVNKGKGRKPIQVLKNEYLPLYLELMQAGGVDLRAAVVPVVREQEMTLSTKYLNGTFVGGEIKLRPISDAVLDEMLRENSGVWREGKSGGKPVRIIKKEFLPVYERKMLEKGVSLK